MKNIYKLDNVCRHHKTRTIVLTMSLNLFAQDIHYLIFTQR